MNFPVVQSASDLSVASKKVEDGTRFGTYAFNDEGLIYEEVVAFVRTRYASIPTDPSHNSSAMIRIKKGDGQKIRMLNDRFYLARGVAGVARDV